jgi:nucleoside-triphosphatase THEP1
LLNIVAIIFGLLLLNFYPLWMAALFVFIYAGLNVARYRRSLHRLKRPRLWISLAVIMMLSGLLLDGLRAENQFWSWKGMLVGLNMTIRAILIILGFSAVSIELRNPRLLAWFTRQGLQEFSTALGVAFEALPEFTAVVSQQKHLWRHPAIIVPQLLRHAEAWLQNYRQRISRPTPVIFLTGEAGQGKTTLAAEVAAKLQEMGVKVGGILAPGFWRDGKRQGFDLINITEGKSVPLCRRDGTDGAIAVGPFQFLPAGLQFGRVALNAEALKKAEVIIVDEIGPLELRGEGWAPALDALVNECHRPMLWVVRKSMMAQVAARWLKTAPLIRDVNNIDATRLAYELRQLASSISLSSVANS